ncbi:MAG: sulfur carrier protein ThiS adenylyltransferase ThiF [Clostridiales bacterium]|nr:sulfur carrier protein ThiS adenylyltransferase ThiF [Clostridiales bacterium]
MNRMEKTDDRKYQAKQNLEDYKERLGQAKVAIAGLGGLGSNIAFALVRSGVRNLHLVDFDRVDESNLNRQQYRMEHIGRYKTEALKEELEEIRGDLCITTDCVKVTPDNVAELFGTEEILCEAFDRAEQKAMLVETALSQLPEIKVVSGCGMAGFSTGNSIRTRKISSRFYLSGDETNGVESGLLLTAARVSICAGHEANMAIRLILGYDEP